MRWGVVYDIVNSMIDRIVAVGLCVMVAASFAGAAPMRTHALKIPSKMEMVP